MRSLTCRDCKASESGVPPTSGTYSYIHSLELTWKWRMAPKGRPISITNRRFSTSMLVSGRVGLLAHIVGESVPCGAAQFFQGMCRACVFLIRPIGLPDRSSNCATRNAFNPVHPENQPKGKHCMELCQGGGCFQGSRYVIISSPMDGFGLF